MCASRTTRTVAFVECLENEVSINFLNHYRASSVERGSYLPRTHWNYRGMILAPRALSEYHREREKRKRKRDSRYKAPEYLNVNFPACYKHDHEIIGTPSTIPKDRICLAGQIDGQSLSIRASSNRNDRVSQKEAGIELGRFRKSEIRLDYGDDTQSSLGTIVSRTEFFRADFSCRSGRSSFAEG